MRLYFEVARRTYARISTYRSATVAGAFTNTVFGFLLAYVLLAVYAERPEVGGFDAVDAVTFTFVAQGMLMVLGMFNDTEMADRITTGDVIVDLQRPYDHQAWWAGVSYGKAAYYVLFRGIPPFLIGALVFDLRLPSPTDADHERGHAPEDDVVRRLAVAHTRPPGLVVVGPLQVDDDVAGADPVRHLGVVEHAEDHEHPLGHEREGDRVDGVEAADLGPLGVHGQEDVGEEEPEHRVGEHPGHGGAAVGADARVGGAGDLDVEPHGRCTSPGTRVEARATARVGGGRYPMATIVPSPPAGGPMAVSAYILIQTEVGKAAQVAQEVDAIEGVVSAEDVTGPYDVIARAEATTVDELGKMVVSRVQMIDGITRTLTCPVVHL